MDVNDELVATTILRMERQFEVEPTPMALRDWMLGALLLVPTAAVAAFVIVRAFGQVGLRGLRF